MEVRKYRKGEEEELWWLFYHTVHTVNAKDYSPGQIEAWAPADFDLDAAKAKIREINPYVVVHQGRIIGYADLQPNGYIDHFFCHHEYQGMGVGRRLFSCIERDAKELQIEQLQANVSITARPFFEAMGFTVESEQAIELRGQVLANYQMARCVEFI